MQTAPPTAAEVAEALERVYARPELQPPEPGMLDPVREAWRRLWSWIGSLFESFGGLRADTPFLYWTILALLAVAGASIVVYFLYQTLSRLGDPSFGRGAEGRGDPGPGARARTAPEWDALAARMAGEGRFREAALALYQGLLLRLEADGALRYDAAKTPGDYRREARPHPRGPVLAGFLRHFEPVAFGGRAMGADGYERLRAAARGGAMDVAA